MNGMEKISAPLGPNGFIFVVSAFKVYWNVIKDDLLEILRSFMLMWWSMPMLVLLYLFKWVKSKEIFANNYGYVLIYNYDGGSVYQIKRVLVYTTTES